MKVCRVEDIRRFDAIVSSKFGIDDLMLMENAGIAVYHVLLSKFGNNISKLKFAVLAGIGYNGGDALVVARKLYSVGSKVSIYIIGDPNNYRGAARHNYDIVRKLGLKVIEIRNEDNLKILRQELEEVDVVIDGIFGIGLRGVVQGIHRKVIELINRLGKYVVSIDIPSGIGGNDGEVHGVAVRANCTVTFGLPKLGNILYPGFDYCGELYIARISYPPEIYESNELRIEINIPKPPPKRIKWGHKGTFGKLLVIAGAKNYYGAPLLSSYSFLKAGGGYSILAAPKSIIPFIASKASEVVYIPLEETKEGTISLRNYEYILELIHRYDVDIVIIGPGTSLNEETQELIRALVRTIPKPIIIDGDGITAISKDLSTVRYRTKPTVITPHPGEMARLTSLSVNEVLKRRIDILTNTCRELRAYITLKGAHTLIGYPDGRIFINMTGNPGMATAGSGDVLTGTIAAMYGIGYDLDEAVRVGVFIHGLAGDLAAQELGEDGVTAIDIMNYLPKAMYLFRLRYNDVVKKYLPRVID